MPKRKRLKIKKWKVLVRRVILQKQKKWFKMKKKSSKLKQKKIKRRVRVFVRKRKRMLPIV
ncbi:hypothetical protein NQ314_003319 [Rhamnusium bicolor]|uniref:Uncharacterized protein n=1 Tax=Rhamnusium bicolor TaxID=1586634 RepID=A0AAV8ZPJ6_9CUCU|nr:hypothetical protein NQ314_003319 [Rhamnusium bicolor]